MGAFRYATAATFALSLSILPEAALPGVLPTVKALRSKAPKLDGVVQDECWAKAAPCSLTLLSGKQPTQRTVAKVCCDDQHLYIAARCEESAMGQLVRGSTKRDGQHWTADCVEVFIDPERKGQRYRHFVVSAAGGLYDAEVTDPTWNADWRAATKLGPDGWTVEMAIPFASLGLTPAAASSWRINFCREEKPHAENSAWAPVGETFHNPSKFGRMEVGADLSRFFCRTRLLPSSYTVGRNTAQVEIDNMLDAERRGSVIVSGAGPGRAEIGKAKRWLVMPAQGKSRCSLALNLPTVGKYDLTIRLVQGGKGLVAVSRATIEVPAVRTSPADARVRWIRHARPGQVTLMVVHDCTFKAQQITFEVVGMKEPCEIEVDGGRRTIRSQGSRFTDRFCGYGVRIYRWRTTAGR